MKVIQIKDDYAFCWYKDENMQMVRIIPVQFDQIENLNKQTLLGSDITLRQTAFNQEVVWNYDKHSNKLKADEDEEKKFYFNLRNLGLVKSIQEYLDLHNQLVLNFVYLTYSSGFEFFKNISKKMWHLTTFVNGRLSFFSQWDLQTIAERAKVNSLFFQNLSGNGKLHLMLYFKEDDADQSMEYKEVKIENETIALNDELANTIGSSWSCVARLESAGIRIRDLSYWDTEYDNRKRRGL